MLKRPQAGCKSLVSRTRCSVLHAAPLRRDPGDAECTMGPGSAAHHAARHSASKTRVNALMALRSIRGTHPHPCSKFQTRLRDPAARCARVVHLSSAPMEGVGNAGCPLHPRSRVHFVLVERTRVTTSTPESPGIPARNGFTAYFALSPVTGLFCHRRSTDMVLSKPGWADLTPRT